MSNRKRIRLRTFDYVGEYRCFFTVCTDHRRRIFTSSDVVDRVLLQFQQCAEREEIEILAYCFMPDHLHLLTRGLMPASDSLRFIRVAKQNAGFWYSRRTGRPLWKRDVWDRVLRANEDAMDVVRYIFANPVQAKIVTDPFDYPFSGSKVYSREQIEAAFRKNQPDRAEGESSGSCGNDLGAPASLIPE